MPPKLIVEILGDTSRLERSLRRAAGDTKSFGASIGGLGRNIGVALAATGAAALAAGTAAVKMGSNFSEQMQRIVGLSGVAQEQVDKFGKQVLQLAPTVGKSPQELANALYFITSSGIAASKAMDVLTNSAKASVAGLGDTEVVADAVTSAINAYGAANLSATHATDVLVSTVREGKGEASAFAGVIGNVTALASQLGVSFNEVGAALAAETRLGIDAETASVQLQQVFSNLVKVAPQAEKAFKSVGLSSAGLRKELADKGLLATLTTIKDAFAGNLPALAKAFPNIRALRGVLALVGKSAAETTAIFERMADTSGSLATAFAAVSEDTAQQFRKMRASAQVAVVAIGALFAPLAGKIAGGLAAAANAVTGLVAKVTAAKSFSAKLNVVWTGIDEAARSATAALGAAFAKVDWTAVFAKANGIADGFQQRLEGIDWSKVGKTIGDGIAKGIAGAAAATKEIAARFEAAFRTIDWVKLGKAAGPGLAAALVTAFATLTDPSFWLKNWDLALAVAAVAFGGPLGKLGGKLIAPLARVGGRLAEGLALGLSRGIERLGGAIERIGGPIVGIVGRLIERLGSAVLSGLLRLPGLAERTLGQLAAPFVRAFAKLGGLARFTIKVLGVQAVIDEVARLVSTIAGFFGGLAQTLGHALDSAWKGLEEGAIKAALAIVEPFTHIPTELVGHKFQDIKAALQTELDGMVTSTQKAANDMQVALDSVKPPPALTGPATAANQRVRSPADQQAILKATAVARAAAAQSQGPSPAPSAPTASPPAQRKGITAEQRNQFFDSAISSDLGRVGFIESVKSQIAALQRIAGLISARLAATKDVTRRRTLEDQLLSVQATIRGDQKQLATDFIASLQFGFTRAQATAGFGDDLKRLNAIQAALKAEIKATGSTLDLQQQLFDNQQQIIAARNAQRNAGQFKALGLTATGDEVTPGVKRLKGELATLATSLTGTFLDTSKTQSVISNLRKVLSGSLGAVGQEVRAKIQSILDDLNQKLKSNAGNLAKSGKINANALAKSLGLDPEQTRQLRAKLSRVSAAGTVPGVGRGAFGTPLPAMAGGGGPPLIVHTHVHLDKHKVGTAVTSFQQTGRRRNPVQKRGPHTGGD